MTEKDVDDLTNEARGYAKSQGRTEPSEQDFMQAVLWDLVEDSYDAGDGYFTPLTPVYVNDGKIEVGIPNNPEALKDVRLVGPVYEHHVWHYSIVEKSLLEYTRDKVEDRLADDDPNWDSASEAFIRAHPEMFPWISIPTR